MNLIRVNFGTPAFDQLIDLRYRLLRIPLKIGFLIEDINEEYDELHFGLYDDNWELLGCLSYIDKSKGIVKMRQVAVENNHQNNGYGQIMVTLSEEWLKYNGYCSIELNARDVAVNFYMKLKYKKIGKAFIEVGIKHYKMTKVI